MVNSFQGFHVFFVTFTYFAVIFWGNLRKKSFGRMELNAKERYRLNIFSVSGHLDKGLIEL